MTNLFDLTGKVAIVTGSSRGIGKAIAEALAAQGAKVVISSRKQDACDAVAAALNAEHGDGTAIAVAASISSKEALQHLVDQTQAHFGRIDVLVCNAASNPYYGPMAGISDDQFRKILDNNVLANHWLIAMAAPQMVQRGEGSIIIVSSVGGLTSSTVIGAYNISKAADFQLARNLAAEFGPSGVRVNCIAPGLVKTDFAKALWENPDTLKAVTRGTPLRRIGLPHEIAGAAVYLAAPASTFMTGQVMVVDGGSTIGIGLWRLANKVAIVTGAGSGIGKATVALFREHGATVIGADLNGADVTCDAGDETQVAALVDDVVATYGWLDIFFANAGIAGGLASIFEQSPDDWAEILRVNLIGPALAIKHAAPHIKARGGGSIICTASVAGLRSGAGGPAYAASKAGVISLVRTAAQQLTGSNVRVNAICPGLIETGMTEFVYERARAKGQENRLGHLNPLKRGGHPNEIAAAALFLASDESSYVNGHALVVDGGLSSSHPFNNQSYGRTAI